MKKKIIFVIGMFAGGGAEKVLVNMVNQMDLNLFDITIYSVFDTGRRPFIKEGIKIYYSFKVSPNKNDEIKGNNLKARVANFLYTYAWKLMPMKLFYKLVIKEKYDYEVAYVEGIPHKIIAASDNKNSKKYAWIHIDLSIHNRASQFYLNSSIEKRCYSKFDKMIFVSDYSKNKFIEKYNIFDNCITQYNVNEYDKIINISNEEVNIVPNNKPLLVTVGRLHDQKGYDRLLNVVNRLKNENYNFELWIIGDGNQKNQLIDFSKKYNLEDYVKLLGFQANPYKYMKCADWFIAPSRYEGFSTVVSEAFILGKPVFVTNCSGMDEITDNGNYGIIVENNDDEIYYGLKRLLEMNQKEYNFWVDKANMRKNFFNPKERIKEIENLFS